MHINRPVSLLIIGEPKSNAECVRTEFSVTVFSPLSRARQASIRAKSSHGLISRLEAGSPYLKRTGSLQPTWLESCRQVEIMGSCVSALLQVALLVPGSLYLKLFSGLTDGIAVSFVTAVRLGFAVTALLKATIAGLLAVAFITLLPHGYLALLLDRAEAAPTEAGRPVLSKCKMAHRRVFP
ncbi:hypothetical protein VUR80DRAFT_1591 [Thermomyces stellatus]